MLFGRELDRKPGTYLEGAVPAGIKVLICVARGVVEQDPDIDPEERSIIARVARDVEAAYSDPNSCWMGMSLSEIPNEVKLPHFDYDKYIKEDRNVEAASD